MEGSEGGQEKGGVEKEEEEKEGEKKGRRAPLNNSLATSPTTIPEAPDYVSPTPSRPAASYRLEPPTQTAHDHGDNPSAQLSSAHRIAHHPQRSSRDVPRPPSTVHKADSADNADKSTPKVVLSSP
jgi:hypothetical protein